MKVLYAVVSGSYSDYTVHCLCPTHEIAEAVAGKYNERSPHDYTATVEEFSLLESPEEAAQVVTYGVRVDAQGSEVQRWTYTTWTWQHEPEISVMRDSFRTGGAIGRSTRGYDVALKAARDHLAELKANSAGV